MSARTFRILASTLAFALVSSLGAEAGGSAVSTAASAPAPAATTATVQTSPRRNVSPELAEKLAATLPKFVPKKPVDGTAGPNQSAAKLSDVPQNGIIRLPSYEVQEKRLPYHSERDLLTPKGRLDLALKRHPGFNFGPFKFLNHRRALEWLAEEQQAERNAEMADLFGKQRSYELLRGEEKPKPAPTK